MNRHQLYLLDNIKFYSKMLGQHIAVARDFGERYFGATEDGQRKHWRSVFRRWMRKIRDAKSEVARNEKELAESF